MQWFLVIYWNPVFFSTPRNASDLIHALHKMTPGVVQWNHMKYSEAIPTILTLSS